MTDTEYTDIKALRHDIVAEIDAAIILAQTEPEKSLRHLDSARKKIQSIAQRLYEIQQQDLRHGGKPNPLQWGD